MMLHNQNDLTLPTLEDLECVPGNTTIELSDSLGETIHEFEHIIKEQDPEDPTVIALHVETDSFKTAV